MKAAATDQFHSSSCYTAIYSMPASCGNTVVVLANHTEQFIVHNCFIQYKEI